MSFRPPQMGPIVIFIDCVQTIEALDLKHEARLPKQI